MSKQQRPPISLESFLDKMTKLSGLLENTIYNSKLSLETKENIRWYCDWRSHQYYKQYIEYKKIHEKPQSFKTL